MVDKSLRSDLDWVSITLEVEQLIRMVWTVAYEAGCYDTLSPEGSMTSHHAWCNRIGQPPQFDILNIDKWEQEFCDGPD